MGIDRMDIYREIIKENIEYDTMKDNFPYDYERLDEIVELMAETLFLRKPPSALPVIPIPLPQ